MKSIAKIIVRDYYESIMHNASNSARQVLHFSDRGVEIWQKFRKGNIEFGIKKPIMDDPTAIALTLFRKVD